MPGTLQSSEITPEVNTSPFPRHGNGVAVLLCVDPFLRGVSADVTHWLRLMSNSECCECSTQELVSNDLSWSGHTLNTFGGFLCFSFVIGGESVGSGFFLCSSSSSIDDADTFFSLFFPEKFYYFYPIYFAFPLPPGWSWSVYFLFFLCKEYAFSWILQHDIRSTSLNYALQELDNQVLSDTLLWWRREYFSCQCQFE